MKLKKQITINRPIDFVWKVWAEEFDKAQNWMAVVVHSFEKKEGEKLTEAPMIGRICEFSEKPNGPKVLEDILRYDKENYEMHIKVTPHNVPIPLKYNILHASLRSISEHQTEVQLEIMPEINWKGYLLYPLIKKGFSKSFNDILEELKYYVENGQPHPRKAKKLQAV